MLRIFLKESGVHFRQRGCTILEPEQILGGEYQEKGG